MNCIKKCLCVVLVVIICTACGNKQENNVVEVTSGTIINSEETLLSDKEENAYSTITDENIEIRSKESKQGTVTDANIEIGNENSDIALNDIKEENIDESVSVEVKYVTANGDIITSNDAEIVIPHIFSLQDVNVEKNNFSVALDKNNKVYPYSYIYFTEIESKYQTNYLELYNGLYNLDETISITPNLDFDSFIFLLLQLLEDDEDFYYVGRDWNITTDIDGNVNSFSTDYLYTIDEIENYNQQLQSVVNQLQSVVRENKLSDYDTYLFLHDYLVQNVIYDELGEDVHDSDVIGCLLNRICTCEGFAYGYQYLLRNFGYKAALCSGSVGESHLWNMVYYNGEWMHVDVGMDNVDSQIGNDWSIHSNFGLSDKYIENVTQHIITKNSSASDYIVHPSCEGNIDLSFYGKLSDEYIINVDNAYDKILNKAKDVLCDNCNYIEFVCESDEDLSVLQDTILNQQKADFYILLDNIDKASDEYSINVLKAGLIINEWNNTVLLYFFKE